MAKDLGICALIDTYGAVLTEKQRAVLQMYYFEDLSLSEIAELEGISRQGVRDAIKRAEAQLLEMEDRLGLARRFRGMQAGLADISAAAAEISDFNQHQGASVEIEMRVSKIRMLAAQLAADE